MKVPPTLSLTTDGHKDIERSLRRLRDRGDKPPVQNFIAHASAYARAAAAVAPSLRKQSGDREQVGRLIWEWLGRAKGFERTALEACSSGFSVLSIDSLERNWELLTAAEQRLSNALTDHRDAMQLRVIGGKFRREQQATFDRIMNPSRQPQSLRRSNG
jgi:hypothetical protein